MASSIPNINLDKVNCDINSILSDIKNSINCEDPKINIPETVVDEKQVSENLAKLMQVL